ncbi:hypothetical protein P5673_033185, partial [Acropora cervicornis]
MCGQGLWKSETRHSDQEPANQSHGTETEKGRVGLDINQPFKMAATRCLCSLLVFLICWASYAPQSFADLVMIKTPTLLRCGQNTGNTWPKWKRLSKTTRKSSGATTKCSWTDAHALTQRFVTMVKTVATKPAQKAELSNNYFCSGFLSATPDVNIDPTKNSLTTDM